MSRIVRLVLGAVVILCTASGQVCAVSFTETKLGSMPCANIRYEWDVKPMAEQISDIEKQGLGLEIASCIKEPHGWHVAAVVPTPDGKCRLWLDGKFGPEYDQIRHATKSAYTSRETRFSPDGSRLAYTARKGSKWVMVVDGVQSAPYDDVREPYFSADGKNIAYAACRNSKWIMVINGKESPAYYGIPSRFPYILSRTPFCWIESMYCPVAFSENGRVGYVASNGRHAGVDQEYAVIDGKPGPVYEQIGHMEFSPDGKHVAYSARKNEKEFVVLDGKPGIKYDSVQQLCFSPNGKRFAFIATRYDANSDPEQVVVVDGKESPKHRSIQEASLVFSPDSKHLTYTASDDEGTSCFVVLDGKQDPKYDEIGGWNGEVYATFGPRGQFCYRAKRGEKRFLVIDSVPSPAYEEVSAYPVYSQDGAHCAYAARYNDKGFVVRDGVNGGMYSTVVEDSVAFMADGKLVYNASKPDSDSYLAVIDGKELDDRSDALVSKNGKYTAYVCADDTNSLNKLRVEFGGEKSGRFRELHQRRLNDDGTLEFLAVRDETTENGLSFQLYKVTAK